MRPPRLAVLFALATAAPCAGADSAETGAPVFGSEVSVVSLPVFVADKDGRAMRGLRPEDFTLWDDGKLVEVVSFQYVDTTSPEEQEAIREAPAARRRFLLLFDLSFTEPAGLNRARRAGAEFVRRGLAESDLAAVATFHADRGIRVVANFSEDRALLAHAVDTLGVPSLARIEDPLGLAASLENTDIQRAAARQGGTEGLAIDGVLAIIARRMRSAEREHYGRQVMTLIGSLEELGKSLRNVEGRKQILYFSAGFDARILTGAQGSEMRQLSEDLVAGRVWEVDSLARYGDTRVAGQFAEVTRLLASADCVIHSVDVTGLGSDASLTETTVKKDALPNMAGRDSLHFMAAETGGRVFKNANDLDAPLRELADMTSRYYILGYQPEDLAGPGRFHKLKVKVGRKGARLSHRSGYYERLPRARQTVMQRKFEAAQLVMTGVGRNDLAFNALCLPFPLRGEKQALGVVVQVPRGQLRWQAGTPVALEVYGYAVASDGTVRDHIAQLAQVQPEVADPGGTSRGLSFYGTLHVPPGTYTLKLMALEPETGAAGVQFLDVTVPPFDERAGFLLPPVVMDDPARWLGLSMKGREGGDSDFPFEVAGRPFLPRASFLVEGGKAEKLILMAYDPAGPADSAGSGLEIRTTLIDAAGARVAPGSLKIDGIHHQEGRRTYVLAYTPEALAPGDYTLRVGVGESGSNLESYSLLRVGPPSATAVQ